MALYARVSTADKEQDPQTQLMPLRDYCQGQGWEVYREYVDRASADDFARRVAWRQLLDDAASRRYFKVLLVWRIDRAFRAVLDAAAALKKFQLWDVGFRSLTEPWIDTTTPFGEALYHIAVAFAQLEKATMAERIRAGMDRARRQGKHIGRPPRMAEKGFRERWEDVRARLASGKIPSRRKAAVELGVGYPTLKLLLEKEDQHAAQEHIGR